MWHAAVLDVQVAGADARQSDLRYGILRVENPRLRFLQKGKMALVYVCVSFHYLMVTIFTPAGPGVQKQLRAYTSSISFLIASLRIPSPMPCTKKEY